MVEISLKKLGTMRYNKSDRLIRSTVSGCVLLRP